VRQRKAPSGQAPGDAAHATSSHTTSSHTSSSHTTAPPVDRYASIAQAAYFRSQHRGFKPGREIEDWLAAEAEVDQRLRGEGRVSGD